MTSPIEISSDNESEVEIVETYTAPPVRKRARLNKKGNASSSKSKKVDSVERREEELEGSEEEDRKWVHTRISLSPVRPTSKVTLDEDTETNDTKIKNIKRLSLSPIRPVRLDSDDEAMKKEILKKIKNPNVKIKKGMELNEDTLWDRIKRMNCPLYDVPLPHAIRDVAVPRDFLSSIYGGNTQDTFPRIGKKHLDRHGMDDFLYPVLDFNPQAPQVPGAPGLFFSLGNPCRPEETYRLIVRLKPCSWLYMGQYKFAESGILTVAEWNAQSRLFHNTWIKWMMTGAAKSPSVQAIRIAARKRYKCQTPTRKQLDAIEESGAYKDITADEIKAAILAGEEVIRAWEMRCVGYDVAFQQNIADEFSRWRPKPKKTAAKNKKPTSQNKPSGQNNKKRKRRVVDSESSESSSEVSELDEGEESEV